MLSSLSVLKVLNIIYSLLVHKYIRMFRICHRFLAILLLVVILFSCKKEVQPMEVLLAAKKKIKEAQALRYNYISHWDNRFNETTFRDTASLVLSQLENDSTIYGVHAITRGDEYIFSGYRYTEVLHSDSAILNTYPSVVNEHPKDVMSSTFMMNVPLDILQLERLDYFRDTIVENTSFAIFRNTTINPSVSDSNILMTHHTDHYFSFDSFNYDRVEITSIRDIDTLQVIVTKFQDLVYEEVKYDFSITDRLLDLDYKMISRFAEDEEREALAVDVGEQIVYQSFDDILGEEITITNSNRTSVIMFSFIGCGACEIAMKKMQDQKMKFAEDVDFYYSSPVDKSEVLQKYLLKKKFGCVAFGKESKMNDHFGVYSYPTFVVLNDQGIVQRIEFGYDDNIADLLFAP